MSYLSPTRLLPLTIAAIAVVLVIRLGTLTATAACAAPAACGASAGVSPPPPPTGPSAGAPASPAPDFVPPRFGSPTDADKALLEDLRVRSGQIDAREAALAQREASGAATEKRLNERLGELGALAGRLEGLDKALKQRDEANWQDLVKLYENMRPRDAAAIFNDLATPVLLEVMDRMKPLKAAPIMAAMNAEKARQVTTELASKRTASVTLAN
jgi:flagellar motility protein MotE (MotC chaperone)